MIKKDRIVIILNIGVILLFALLLYKDPFSERTLIPNFEPYPDTFSYINPSLNLAKGNGFNMGREGRTLTPNTPALYSFVLLPAFIFKADPRVAYYANVFLAFVSFYLFWLIIRKLILNRLLILFVLILYITNYFIYWIPSLIMAENLTLTLYLAAIYFLLSKTTKFNVFLVALSAVGSYATKYASIPLTVVTASLCLGKIFSEKIILKSKINLTALLLTSVAILFLLFGIFESFTKGNDIVSQITGHILRIYNSILHNFEGNTAIETSETAYASSWFGVEYIKKNLPLYLKSILGEPNRFLWDNTPLVPKLVALGGIAGILVGIIYKNFRFISLSLFITILSLVIFQSTFYSFDARYIYVVIPALLIGLGILLDLFFQKVFREKKTIFLNALIIIIITAYLISSFTRIKSQISLNLRYRETPWNYIAVMKMNEYFTPEKIKENKKPVLISALPPFLIDYYSNDNYILLPLAYEQEFRGQNNREIIWGPNDYSDLPKLYRKYLSEGYELYVSRAGLGNESYTNKDFNTIADVFDIKIVLPGCFDQCNIYSVRLKDDNGK